MFLFPYLSPPPEYALKISPEPCSEEVATWGPHAGSVWEMLIQ